MKSGRRLRNRASVCGAGEKCNPSEYSRYRLKVGPSQTSRFPYHPYLFPLSLLPPDLTPSPTTTASEGIHCSFSGLVGVPKPEVFNFPFVQTRYSHVFHSTLCEGYCTFSSPYPSIITPPIASNFPENSLRFSRCVGHIACSSTLRLLTAIDLGLSRLCAGVGIVLHPHRNYDSALR